MTRKSTNFCRIDFDRSDQSVQVNAFGSTLGGLRNYGGKKITLRDLEKAIGAYWDFADQAIRTDALANERTARTLYSHMKSQGTKLCNMLFEPATRRSLWGLAAESRILVLFTDLMHVPWEALFNPERGRFLSDDCVVVRWPLSTERERGATSAEELENERVFLLDSMLAGESFKGGCCIADQLRNEGRLHVTTDVTELIAATRNVRVVHWICHHERASGLRLSENAFYSVDDSRTFFFPPKSVLFLTSCSSGKRSADEASIAAEISVESDCTVIAPSSDIGTEAGVEFATKINAIIRESDKPMDVADLWTCIKAPSPQASPDTPSVEMVYSRWYGIYGDGAVRVRSGGEGQCN